jgi:hypothetical protein
MIVGKEGMGSPILKAPVKRKKYSVSKKKRFSRENDAAAWVKGTLVPKQLAQSVALQTTRGFH